ncbi:MAG: bi-domain-containing oxidoreductase [Candidatus Kapaibacterium sp.]
MFQVLQHLQSGELSIEELPAPGCKPGGVLVRTCASLISAGTERTSVQSAQSSLIDRARKQPDQVRQVFEMMKKDGVKTTVQKVLSKLDSYKTLGYSAAGVVIESRCDEFAVGDRVACAGAQFAHHAEILSVPKNLVVRLPDTVSFDDAAYTTVGAIALQGVRQADVRLGETVVVIGIGLLGQLTIQLLKASGCTVIGLDINESQFERARQSGCDHVLASSPDSLATILAVNHCIGVDAVIITASTDSDAPVDLSMKMLRKKGKLVIVGVTGMNLKRSPFYEKEIDVRISCSYGPGRYDPLYEEGGIDYPAGYVRWTENRNMQAFVDCIAKGTLNVNALTTHRFPLHEASKAYDLVTGKDASPSLGIILRYEHRDAALSRVRTLPTPRSAAQAVVGVIGAGSFAQSMLIPPLRAHGARIEAVSASTPANAHSVAKRVNAPVATTDGMEIIRNSDISLVVCASPHSSHAHYVTESLKAGKAVFVEKPLCITSEELLHIHDVLEQTKGRVMVGFNRRFSAPLQRMKKFFEGRRDPLTMMYRVNAGFIPKTHWIQAPSEGGRIIGEVCHFIDCMVFLSGALPTSVHAVSTVSNNSAGVNHDNVVITCSFADGSVGTVVYTAQGDGSLAKEYFEAHAEQRSAVMNNFTELLECKGKKQTKHSFNGGKGHSEEIAATLMALKNGTEMPITFAEISATTAATLAAVESLHTQSPMRLIDPR